MSAMSRTIRACAAASGASGRSLASVEAMGAGGAWVKGPPAAGRWAGRGGRGPVEDGARVQWVFLGCPRVSKGTYAGRLSRLLGVPHIATSDLVHDELASQGPLSKQFQNNNVAATLEDTMVVALRSSVEFDEGRAWSREGWIVLLLEFSLCVEPPNGAAVFGNCHVTLPAPIHSVLKTRHRLCKLGTPSISSRANHVGYRRLQSNLSPRGKILSHQFQDAEDQLIVDEMHVQGAEL